MTISTATKITVLKHLVNGRDKAFVAQVTELTQVEVIDIASKHGYPDVDKMKWALDVIDKPAAEVSERPTRPASSAPRAVPAPRPELSSAKVPPHSFPGTLTPSSVKVNDPTGKLLAEAAKSSKKRTQNLGQKITDLLEDLRHLVESEKAEREAAEQAAKEAAANAARIAELEAELAKLKGKSSPKTKSGAAAGPSAKEIRDWAAKNGIDCPAVGVVRKDVRDAYIAAHRGSAA